MSDVTVSMVELGEGRRKVKFCRFEFLETVLSFFMFALKLFQNFLISFSREVSL